MDVSDQIIAKIDEAIQGKHLLNHPFYMAWSRGELSLKCLQEYAKEYYHHVKAFPTYLSAAHSCSSDADTRRILLQNLIEEEAGSPNHPELWRQFALALGVTEEELREHQPNQEIADLIADFRKVCSQGSTAEAVVSLYAYESQIPAICVSKIKGLREYYQMKDPAAWHYFSIHIEADKEHAAQERELLQTYCNHANEASVLASCHQILDRLWGFLSGMCHRHGIAC